MRKENDGHWCGFPFIEVWWVRKGRLAEIHAIYGDTVLANRALGRAVQPTGAVIVPHPW